MNKINFIVPMAFYLFGCWFTYVAWVPKTSRRYPVKKTETMRIAVCPHCGKAFSGRKAILKDPERGITVCETCRKPIKVDISIQYICTTLKKEGDVS